MATILLLHESVDVPEPPVIDEEDRVHERLVEFVVAARVTLLVNPFRGDTVIVEGAPTPTVVATLVGLAAMEKSGTSGVWKTPVVPVAGIELNVIASTRVKHVVPSGALVPVHPVAYPIVVGVFEAPEPTV